MPTKVKTEMSQEESQEEFWDTPEFNEIRGLVDEFIEKTEIEGISNSEHALYVAEDFCNWCKKHYPEAAQQCSGKEIIYHNALLDWQIDNDN